MFGSNFWQLFNLLQGLVGAAAGLLTALVCLIHRRLSPWLYVIAFGIAAGIASNVSSLMYTLLAVLGEEASFAGEWMQLMFRLGSPAGTAGRLLIFGGLVGFILDVRRQLAMFQELQRDLKDGNGEQQPGRRGSGD